MADIAFIDLAAQQALIREKVDAAIARVLEHGRYIMGPEVAELEERLSAFGGAPHTISCASGTDALGLPLMAWGLRPGDAVFLPAFTFPATGEAVAWLGATPVFCDVLPDTYCIDPDSLVRAIEMVRAEGRLNPRAIMAVDLFGQAADYPRLREIADEHGLKLVSDAAQGFGSKRDGAMSSKWADVVATSFFPAKPLGCYGDGGAIQVHDEELDAHIRSLRVHGASTEDRYDIVRIGMNGRLDTMQAAILLEKLAIFEDEIERRQPIAARYAERLRDVVTVPHVPDNVRSTWAIYTILLPEAGMRESFMKGLNERGVPSAAYYPRPMHVQTAYAHQPVEGGRLPVSEDLAARCVALPMHPYLEPDVQDRVCEAVREVLTERSAAA